MKHFTLLLLTLFFLNTQSIQAQNWIKALGSSNIDQALDIKVDAAGNSYIVGFFSGTIDLSGDGTLVLSSAGLRDIFFAKYDALGNLLFAKGIGGSGNDEGNGIELDNSGNLIIVGQFSNFVDFDPTIGVALKSSAGFTDVFIAKYDVGGSFVSVATIEGTGTDRGEHIVRSSNGDIYISGQFSSDLDFVSTSTMDNLTTAQSSASFLAKFDDVGNYIWANKLESTDDVKFNDLALDGNGNIYGTGIFKADTDFNPGANSNVLTFAGNTDAFLVKYNNNGALVWARALQGIDIDVANDVAITHDGNVLVAGVFSNSIDLDPSGNAAFVTSTGQRDIFFANYSPNGHYRWGKRLGGTGNDYAYSITSDNQRRIFLAGSFQSTIDANPNPNDVFNLTSAGDADMFFIKLDSVGNFKNAVSVGGSNGDLPQRIAVNNTQQLYATGWFQGTCNFLSNVNLTSKGDRDIFTAKIDISPNYTSTVSLIQNQVKIFPNPFINSVTVEDLDDNISDYSIEIVDISGRVVASFQNLNTQILDLSQLERGMYFLYLKHDNAIISVKKLIKNAER